MGVPDVEPPTVVSSTPADNASRVSRYSSMTICFSEPVDLDTLVPDHFVLTRNGIRFADVFISEIEKDSVCLKSRRTLYYFTNYVLTVTDGITHMSGNPLVEKQIRLKTKSSPYSPPPPHPADTTPPTVQSIKTGGSDVDLVNDTRGYNIAMDQIAVTLGLVFSLPSESQWEYAARGGVENQKYSGSDDPDAVGLPRQPLARQPRQHPWLPPSEAARSQK